MKWKPIETAPKDGTLILVYIDYVWGHHNRDIVLTRWDSSSQQWKEDGYPNNEKNPGSIWGDDWAIFWTEFNEPPDVASIPSNDTTGLGTVRELAADILAWPRIHGECVCELAFTDDAGRHINMECAVTFVDGVPHARQWKPKFSFTKFIKTWMK